MPRTRMLTSTRAGRTVVQVQKWPKRLPNINLTGQRNTGFQNKRKSTVLYTTTSLSNFGVSKYTPFIIVKMHKNANFSKNDFQSNAAICLFYYCAMHYRQHRLEKKPQMNWKYTATFFFEVELGTINQVRKYCCPKFCWIQMTAWQIELCTKKNKSYE